MHVRYGVTREYSLVATCTRGAHLQDCERVSVKHNERALTLCTPCECNVRVRASVRSQDCKCVSVKHVTRTCFTNEGFLRVRKECEHVTRDSYVLVRLRETRIYARVTCKDFLKTYYI